MNSMHDDNREQETREPWMSGQSQSSIMDEIQEFEMRYFLQIKLAGLFLLWISIGQFLDGKYSGMNLALFMGGLVLLAGAKGVFILGAILWSLLLDLIALVRRSKKH